jgi:NAD(P)-dependent dehydrogenase (short-subunit alcohol dehydrogenase family)
MRDERSQVVLITGATSGMGRACAAHLHQLGHRVYGCGRRAAPPPADPTVAPEITEEGFNLLCMDVTDEESVARGVAYVLAREGRIDVLVNNAGFGYVGAIEETSLTEAQAQFDTNFFGVLRLCRAVVPAMRERRAGLIVTISSLGGRFGVPFQAMYSASKFAVEGLCEALRLELQPFGIRVAMVEPGKINTDFFQSERLTAETRPDGPYARYLARERQVAASEPGSQPMVVARRVARLMRHRAPALRNPVGPLRERLGIVAKSILPWRVVEWALLKFAGWD